jgi:hypothetical protein
MARTPARSLAVVDSEDDLGRVPEGILGRLVSSLVTVLLTG